MQQEIRFTLFIIGIAIIGGVLLHGIWTIRKNAKKSKRTSFESNNWEPGFQHEDDLEAEGPYYDDVGVSKARVIINPANDKAEGQKLEMPNEDLARKNDHPNANDLLNTELSDDESHIGNVDFESSFTQQEDLKQNSKSTVLADVDISPKSSALDDFKEHNLKDNDIEKSHIEEASRQNNNIESEDKHDETIADKEVEAERSENEQISPVYSNVVTQPKPEFTRPIVTKENTLENYGQPPGFLLKKSSSNNHQVDDTQLESSLQTKPSISHDSGDENVTTNIEENVNSQQTQAVKVDSPNISPLNETKTPKTPEFSLNIQEGPDIPQQDPKLGVEKELSFAEQAKRFVRRNKKTVADKIRKEPVIKTAQEDQMRIDFDEAQTMAEESLANNSAVDETNTSSPSNAEPYTGEPEVLVLNVRANNDNPIEGAALLPMLLTLGFKFGEHDIFHRHVSTNGKGPILFSLTNMFKPGVFDIDNIENFNTLGVSLFMMLPIEGDAQQVFNMMHNAARKLSEEFSCRILDGNKVGLSKQSLQQYIERIRDFERKRINK